MEREEELEIHRLLGPQRAVVVERGDAFGGRNEVRRAFLRHLRDEGDDRPSWPRCRSRRGAGRAAETVAARQLQDATRASVDVDQVRVSSIAFLVSADGAGDSVREAARAASDGVTVDLRRFCLQLLVSASCVEVEARALLPRRDTP